MSSAHGRMLMRAAQHTNLRAEDENLKKKGPLWKTLSFSVLHFGIAFTVAYLLTDSALIGGLISVIEPAYNTVAFYFHERI